MASTSKALYGTTVSTNKLPPVPANSKVVLNGTWQNQKKQIGLDESILSKHMMLIGGTGSGKSTLFYHIVDQLKRNMKPDDVMIIFDSKGDFYEKFGSGRDIVIGNSPQYLNQSEKWNIFKEIFADGPDWDRINMNIQEIARSLFAQRVEKANDPFFPNAARDLFAAILTRMIDLGMDSSEFRGQVFFNDALKTYLDTSTIESLREFIEEDPMLHSVLSYLSGGDGQAYGVLAEMNSVLRDIFQGIFKEHGMFSIRDFVRNKNARTLFIEYDLSIGSVLTPVYRLLFDLALKEALGRNKTQGNVYLICDEFKLLPNLQHIDDGVNFGRSLGVKIFAGLQSIQQLYDIYGEARGQALASGFSSVIAFRANDSKTRDFVSQLHGANYVLERYTSLSNQYVEKERSGKSVEDWDLNSLQVGEAIVGFPFTAPFRFYFDMYRG